MDEDERKLHRPVVLGFDEMKLKKRVSFDAREQQVRKAADQFHVACIRGLAMPFKQPVWCGFDQKMTKEIFDEIIVAVEDAGYEVVVNVADQGGGNRGFYTKLGVTPSKPYYPHPLDPSPTISSTKCLHDSKSNFNSLSVITPLK